MESETIDIDAFHELARIDLIAKNVLRTKRVPKYWHRNIPMDSRLGVVGRRIHDASHLSKTLPQVRCKGPEI
jgi:hypothetical protein